MSVSPLPINKSVSSIRLLTIAKGSQTIVRFEGSSSLIVAINPADSGKPYFIYEDRGFRDQIELGVDCAEE
jgi:hypothetical protein